MQLVRTTLRLDKNLKKEAQIFAIQNGISFQELCNRAINQLLTENTKQEVKEMFDKKK